MGSDSYSLASSRPHGPKGVLYQEFSLSSSVYLSNRFNRAKNSLDSSDTIQVSCSMILSEAPAFALA